MEVSVEKTSLFDFLVDSGGLTNKVPRKVAVQSCLPLFTRQLVDDTRLSEESQYALECELDLFIKNITKRWNASKRSREKLAKTAGAFLHGLLKVTVTVRPVRDKAETGHGRPSLPYSRLSQRTKRRHSGEVAKQHPIAQLLDATAQSARADKEIDLAHVLREAGASPGRPAKIRKAVRESHMPKPECASPDEALAMCVSADLDQLDTWRCGKRPERRRRRRYSPPTPRSCRREKNAIRRQIACCSRT